MRELICHALYGAMGLASAFRNWLAIATRLAEPPRRRKTQPDQVEALLANALP